MPPIDKTCTHGPDGFQTSRSTYKPPPKFVSSFTVLSTVSTTRPQQKNNKEPSSTSLLQNSFVGHVASAESATSKLPPCEKQFKRSAQVHRTQNEMGNASAFDALRRPLLGDLLCDKGQSVEKMSISATALQLIKTPLLSSIPGAGISLRRPKIPVISQNVQASTLRSLMPPHPPLISVDQPASQKNMKPISDTGVAQTTNPSKEGTGAELLALVLQQHGHGFTSPRDRELRRGLVVSPEKHSRGGDLKFVR